MNGRLSSVDSLRGIGEFDSCQSTGAEVFAKVSSSLFPSS